MASLMEINGDRGGVELKRDNFDKGDFWFLCDGFNVSIAEQRVGESPIQSIRVPKKIFDYFVKKYTEEQ